MADKSISELWDRFGKLSNYIETEKILNSWNKVGSDGLSHDGRDHKSDEAEIQALRAELLDRSCSDFGIIIYDCTVSMPPRTKLTADKCDEYLAALAFMVWEMKQRAKEKEVGNG